MVASEIVGSHGVRILSSKMDLWRLLAEVSILFVFLCSANEEGPLGALIKRKKKKDETASATLLTRRGTPPTDSSEYN